MSAIPFVKGKLANLVEHGAVMVEDIGLELVRECAYSFHLAGRIRSVLLMVIAAKLGFFVFLKLVRVVISGVAFGSLIACEFAAELFDLPVFSKVAFLYAIHYHVAAALAPVRIFKKVPLNAKVNVFSLALLADIPQELREGYIVAFNFDIIISHGECLFKDMFYFCE
jgi:hypothetical protein